MSTTFIIKHYSLIFKTNIALFAQIVVVFCMEFFYRHDEVTFFYRADVYNIYVILLYGGQSWKVTFILIYSS